jgi:hypothetical protein
MAESLCAVCDQCGKHKQSGVDVRMRGMPSYYPPGWYVKVQVTDALLFCSVACLAAHEDIDLA